MFQTGFLSEDHGFAHWKPRGTSCHPIPPAAAFPPATLWYGSAIREEGKEGKEGICELLTSLSRTHFQLTLEAILCWPNSEKRPHTMPTTFSLQSALPLTPLSQKQRTTNLQFSPSQQRGTGSTTMTWPTDWNWKSCQHREAERSTLLQDPFLSWLPPMCGRDLSAEEGGLAADSCSPERVA